MARILALVAGVWMGFVIALLLLSMATPALTAAGLAEPTDQDTSRQVWRVVATISWLVILVVLVAVLLAYAVMLLRRRHIGELAILDATDRPLPMRRNESAWAAQLEALGLHRLGEVELRPRFDRPLRFWIYASHDGLSVAEISRRWKRVSFSSGWGDGTTLTTVSTPRPAVQLAHYRYQSARDLWSAYQLHVQTAPYFGVGHGPATLVRSMADDLAEERRRQALITPEIMAHQRIRGHLAVSALISVLVAGIILLWPF
jgi:hypothetical protein